MKPSILLATVCAILLAVSATPLAVDRPRGPFHPGFLPPPPPQHPLTQPPAVFYPPPAPRISPPSGGPPPSLPPPPPVDTTKCTQAMQDTGLSACSAPYYDAAKCCSHLKALAEACINAPYRSPSFGIYLKNVCYGSSSGSSPSPPFTG